MLLSSTAPRLVIPVLLTEGFPGCSAAKNPPAKGEDAGTRTLEAFCYRVAKYIGSYMVALNGVDGICFTAGVGENSGLVRSMICEKLAFTGITLDQEANGKRGEDIIISSNAQGPKVMVIPTNEELMIARDTYALTK